MERMELKIVLAPNFADVPIPCRRFYILRKFTYTYGFEKGQKVSGPYVVLYASEICIKRPEECG